MCTKKTEVTYLNQWANKEKLNYCKTHMFVCPVCDCVFFSDDHPSCTVYRCQNVDRKYNEDI